MVFSYIYIQGMLTGLDQDSPNHLVPSGLLSKQYLLGRVYRLAPEAPQIEECQGDQTFFVIHAWLPTIKWLHVKSDSVGSWINII